MSQFGAQTKNPPWVRTNNQPLPGGGLAPQPQMQPQMMGQALGQQGLVQYQQPQQHQVFQPNQMNIQQAPSMTMGTLPGQMGQPAIGSPQMFSQVATVSYPTPRALNPTAFQSPPVSTIPPVPTTAPPSQPPKQRVFSGTVTKVHDNFGFVDEDVFFQTSSCVKGSNPVVGDRVLVEASFNPNMPFKWNATRIQVLPMSGTPNQHQRPPNNISLSNPGLKNSQNAYNAVPPPSDGGGGGGFIQRNSHRKPSSNLPSSRRDDRKDKNRSDEDDDRKKRRDDRRDREEKDKRSPSLRRRSKSPRQIPRRRARIVPRYMVQIPKIALDLPEADVLELRRRYTNLYVPSDFFSTHVRWVDAFPAQTPFTLDRPCSFHVLHKDVDALSENSSQLEPPDADYLFSAKVMLMSMPTMDEMYRKCCPMAEDRDGRGSSTDKEGDIPRDFVHPTRLVNFLVGLRGKNETMAVGGPWSPSLDGTNPEKDPSVLIKTAIRSCRALTGIDLSNCTQWYRFLEIYYHRAETTHKGRHVPARVETVVVFLPDVWSCVPTRLEWDGLHLNYKKQLDRRLSRGSNSEPTDNDVSASPDQAEKDEKDDMEVLEVKKEPTHYAELDPKTMKVNELRHELEARILSPKGLKSQLIARLTKALKTEAEKAEEEDDGKKEDEREPTPKSDNDDKDEERKKKDDEDKKKQDEKERALLEKRYVLPETPHILVHPSKSAKSGKFDCTVMTLSILLDYRPEDTKEHSFEVSLFAELFNEMLMRDFGFKIYQSLVEAPDFKREEEKERKKDKKDEKERKEDRKNGRRDEKDESRRDDDEEDYDEDEDDEDSKDSKHVRDRDDRKKDRERSKDKKKKERTKLYTEDPSLLLSFIYFDQSHCGYIFDKDIEELLYTLGLNLSRAQVRKLVQKVVTRDSLHYRRLTDKSKEENKEKEEKDKTEKKEEDEKKDNKTDTHGNKRYLPVFDNESEGGPPCKRMKRSSSKSENSELPEGFTLYKGSMLDIGKLMDQLKRSEKARTDTEDKMLSLRDELVQIKDSYSKSSANVKELNSELKEYKSKLHHTQDSLSKVQADSDLYLNTLKDIETKIAPVISKSLGEQDSSDQEMNTPKDTKSHHDHIKSEIAIKSEVADRSS